MTVRSSRIMEMFKNLKSDTPAMSRAPRPRGPTETVNDEPTEQVYVDVEDIDDDEQEEIVIEPEEDDIKKKKSRKKLFSFFFDSSFKRKKTYDNDYVKPSKGMRNTKNSVNVKATGNVYNVVNAKDVRLGDNYYFGTVTSSPTKNSGNDRQYEDKVEKDNFITLLMECTKKPEKDYMDYISKNLGKNWHSVFRSLGFTQGRIETAELNATGYDISEARYKLLLDWVRNEDDGSLGRLATHLWEEGERTIVKHLSLMYKKNKK